MASDVAGSDLPQDPHAPVQYVAHPLRWSLLAVYAAASFMGALVWNILVRGASKGVLNPACGPTRPSVPLTHGHAMPLSLAGTRVFGG